MTHNQTEEGGWVAMWTAVLALVIFAFAGVVIDAGYALDARRGADRIAEQAARLAADQVDPDSVHSGQVIINPAAAQSAATEYLHRQGVSGNVSVDGDTVTVTVEDYQRASILGAIGVDGFNVEGSASATTVDGQPVVNPD